MRHRLFFPILAGGALWLAGCQGDAPTAASETQGGGQAGIGFTSPTGPHNMGLDKPPAHHRGGVPLAVRVGLIDPLEDDRESNSWHRVDFDPPFHPESRVVVVSMTQTFRGGEPPGLRIRNVDPTGFEIRFNEVTFTDANLGLVEADGIHIDEVVGWAAYAFKEAPPKDDDGPTF